MPARILLKAFVIASLATVVACDDSTAPAESGNESTIHVVNGTLGDARRSICHWKAVHPLAVTNGATR